MTPQGCTPTNLNPFAPEYNPIPAGVTPSLHAPPPFFFPQPPSTARRPWPSSPLQPPHQIHTYLPSTSHNTQQQFYPNPYSTYYLTPKNQASTTQPPRPTAAVAAQNGQLGRRSTRRGRGYGRVRGRWRERESCWNERVGRNSVGLSKHEQFSRRGMQKEENKHKIMPLKRDEERTTVMIKNIPYDCPRKELISMLDNFCWLENQKAGNEQTSREEAEQQQQLTPYAYDFVYLPIDFRTKKSRGFAFVNFISSRASWKFFDSFHLKKWDLVERLKWPKKIEIVCAKIQGKEELVSHFSESIFECGTDDFLPVCFSPARDGSGQPVEVTVVGNRLPAGRWEWRYNHKA